MNENKYEWNIYQCQGDMNIGKKTFDIKKLLK